MDEGVLDEKTQIERYTSHSLKSLWANPTYDDLIEFRDVFTEAVPCELPNGRGTRHEITLKTGSKYWRHEAMTTAS